MTATWDPAKDELISCCWEACACPPGRSAIKGVRLGVVLNRTVVRPPGRSGHLGESVSCGFHPLATFPGGKHKSVNFAY